jgi:hypothetical protein
MADIKVLMVTDGNRFNFGPPQGNVADDNYFGLSELVSALRGSTTPTIEVDTAHRRGHQFAGQDPDTSLGLTYAGDFTFVASSAPNTVTTDLSQYDVLWMIGDEGYNGGTLAPLNVDITDPEKIAIATFMQNGGGVFAVGDHDGIGACLCGKLPRVRVMRKWYEWDHPFTDPASGQILMTNWSSDGDGTDTGYPAKTDRFDTLQPDSADHLFYFNDQSDPIPQPLLDKSGTALKSSADPIHAILRGQNGDILTQFPDHMHEGEATNFAAISTTGSPFNPNDSHGNPNSVTYTDAHGHKQPFVEFPSDSGYQPQPELICYGHDSGHQTLYGTITYGKTNAKTRGVVSVYDGHAAGVGRIVTGSTFHHYLDKNLIGDPQTESTTPGVGPTNSDLGLPAPTLSIMTYYYVNTVTWLARLSQNFHFWTLKNTYGLDEVADAAAHGLTFDNAFYLAVEGFSPNQVGANPAIALSGPFQAAGATFHQGTPIPEDSGSPNKPQRILVPFTVKAIPATAFPASGALVLPLEARLNLAGNLLVAEALFELVAGADPYFANVDPAARNAFYLSQDLRVFQVAPGVSTTIPFGSFPIGGSPNGYLTQVLGYLNDPAHGYTAPGGSDPFQQLFEAGDLTEASSIAPIAIGEFGFQFPCYNFAIARVRLKGAAGDKANGVKVFFRIFATASNDTDYEPQTTYLSTADPAHLPDTPLAGLDQTTFPLFASGSASGDYDPGTNQRDIEVGASGEKWAYFGCYLDVFGTSVGVIGSHHCLVAQIAWDGAPILNSNGITLSPENSDKLAQRNIQVTASGNPGGPAVHRVPQAFDSRPSLRTAAPAGTLLGYPDELMIDWGGIPIGSKVSIYWPQANASDVVRLGMLLNTNDSLIASDPHTVELDVTSRYAYIPIPFGASGNFGGLFTVDLPLGVRYGQEFNIVVRRLSTRQVPAVDVPQIRARAATRSRRAVKEQITRDWRYVVGSFQITIPVKREETLLWPEENLLAILKWRLQQQPAGGRWIPVLKRYIAYVSGRVQGFGGDPGTILPSPTGAPPPKGKGKGSEGFEFTGKVCEVVFDCFGGFEAFVLECCTGCHRFHSHERAIADLVLRACRERLTLTVVANREQRIVRLIVRC